MKWTPYAPLSERETFELSTLIAAAILSNSRHCVRGLCHATLNFIVRTWNRLAGCWTNFRARYIARAIDPILRSARGISDGIDRAFIDHRIIAIGVILIAIITVMLGLQREPLP